MNLKRSLLFVFYITNTLILFLFAIKFEKSSKSMRNNRQKMESFGMKIVKANKNQLEELIKLQKQYMEHHKEIDDYFAFRKEMSDIWKKYITQVFQDDSQVVFVAIVGETIGGYLTARIMQRPPIYEISTVGLIGDAFVMKSFRRQGIFTKLVHAALEWMKQKGIRYVEHPVAARNHSAIEAWKKAGFTDYMIFMKRTVYQH